MPKHMMSSVQVDLGCRPDGDPTAEIKKLSRRWAHLARVLQSDRVARKRFAVKQFAGVLTFCHLATACLWIACVSPPVTADERSGPVRDERRITQLHVETWLDQRHKNIVMQSRDFSCGAAALATLIQYFWGDPIGEEQLLRELDQMLTQQEITDRINNGLTLTDLRRVAVRLKYQSTIGELEFQQLSESKVPVVVGVEVRGYKHFVVYRGTDGNYVYLADPARGNLRTPVWQFQQQWQDNAVLVVAKPGSDVPSSSALSVQQGEREFGWLNQQLLRKNFIVPNIAFPPAIRP